MPKDRNGKEAKEEIIGHMEINDRVVIRFCVVEWDEKKRFDIRTLVLTKDGETFIPTRKGISVPLELYDTFKLLVDKSEEFVKSGS